MTTEAQLFTRCGQALCGTGPKWKEQVAAMLQVQTNTVDNWSKGTSRIPPAVWTELYGCLQDRYAVIGGLIAEAASIDPDRGLREVTGCSPRR